MFAHSSGGKGGGKKPNSICMYNVSPFSKKLVLI